MPNSSKDLLLEKGLPANLDAERAVLGALLTDAIHWWTPVIGVLDINDFSLEKHRRIFIAMKELAAQSEVIDRITVASRLIGKGQLESIDGLGYLVSLDEGLPSTANTDSYIRIVSEKSALRSGIFTAQKIINRFLEQVDPVEVLLSDVERLAHDFGRHVAHGTTTRTSLSPSEHLRDLDINSMGREPENTLKTPYKILNEHIVGFRPGELVVLGARPSCGKTVAGLEIATAVAEAGIPAVFFSLETRALALLKRGACNHGEIHATKMRHGHLDSEERRRFMAALAHLKTLPLLIDEQCQTFSAMVHQVRLMKDKPKLMVVDHLHLMRTNDRSENRNHEIAKITRDMKLFAGQMDLTLLVLCQLNRASDKENRPPELRDLRDSGSIEADADVILFLHRKDKAEDHRSKLSSPPIPVDLTLAKQRDGVSHLRIPLHLIGKHYRFQEVAG